jgi:ribonuclease P protein component
VIGRLLRSVDFERVLGRPTCARSPHFAVHYLAEAPSRKKATADVVEGPELSTAEVSHDIEVVDDFALNGIWLGSVVPKRHARRAVTRNLLKRQIRQAVGHQAGSVGDAVAEVSHTAGLAKGLWVVRLRTPFDKKKYPSAFSDALRLAAAEELGMVLAQAARRVLA